MFMEQGEWLYANKAFFSSHVSPPPLPPSFLFSLAIVNVMRGFYRLVAAEAEIQTAILCVKQAVQRK